MAKDLADLVVTLELQSAKYQQGFDQATARLNRFHKETGDSLKKITELFATALSVEAVVSFAESTINAAADLENFSKASGIAVEQLSALQFAAKAGGVGTDGLTTALKKLNVAISEAAGNSESKAAIAFQLLGISAKDANGNLKDANTVFTEVADKFAKTADGANKVALAVAIFGKAGEELIPTLDKGSAGLQELADKAKAAGAIISEDTAKAALEFREKAELLKTTLIDGLGAEIEKQLLPTLNNLVDDFNATGKAAEAIKPVADFLVGAFRLVVSALIEASVEIKTVKDSFIALANIGDAAIHGHFAEIARLWKESNAQNDATIKAGQDAAAALYRKGGDDAIGEVKVTAKKIQEQLGSLAGAEAAQAALKTLQAFVVGLQEQALKLDQGTVAATKYKLAHGELAKALALTGTAGQKLASQAVAAATKIETDAVTKQIEGLQAQLKSLSGDTAGAALDQFNKSVETLGHQLQDVGGETQKNGQAVIDALRQATVYQNTFNLLQANSARIQQDGAAAEQKINDAQAAGQLTSIEAEKQLQAVRANTIAQLQGIKNGEDSVAAASGNPALIQNAKAFGAELDHLKAHTDELANQIRTDLENAFANDFLDLETGAASFGQTFHKLAQDIQKDLLQIANKNLAESIFGSGGAGSSAPGFLASLFGSGGSLFGGGGSGIASTGAAAAGTDTGALADSIPVFANGGILPSGKLGLVGDQGPEFVVGAAGGSNVIPNGKLGGDSVNVTNHFVIQSQNGMISKPSQAQTAAAVARSLEQVRGRRTA